MRRDLNLQMYISCCIEAASAAFDAASKVPSNGEEAVSFEEPVEAEKLKALERAESEPSRNRWNHSHRTTVVVMIV